MTGGDARLRDAMDGFDILTYDNIILFHYARAETEFCYEAMEIFKDGMGFSRKGKSKMKKWGMTHVFVFSNSRPGPSAKLTSDRIVIHDLAGEPSFVSAAAPEADNDGADYFNGEFNDNFGGGFGDSFCS